MGKASRRKRERLSRPERFQVICPHTGAEVIATDFDSACELALDMGTWFFYEMDGAGPFFERPQWCWLLRRDADGRFKAERKSLAELERAHELEGCAGVMRA